MDVGGFPQHVQTDPERICLYRSWLAPAAYYWLTISQPTGLVGQSSGFSYGISGGYGQVQKSIDPMHRETAKLVPPKQLQLRPRRLQRFQGQTEIPRHVR